MLSSMQIVVFSIFVLSLSLFPEVSATLLDPGYYAKFIAPNELLRLNSYLSSQRNLTSAQASFLYEAMDLIANFSGKAIPDQRATAIELFGPVKAKFLLTGRTSPSPLNNRQIEWDGHDGNRGPECDCSQWERYHGDFGDYCDWPHEVVHTGSRCWDRTKNGDKCYWDGTIPFATIGCGFWKTRHCDGTCAVEEPPPYIEPPPPSPTGYEMLVPPSSTDTEWGPDLWTPPPPTPWTRPTPTSTSTSTSAKETVLVVLAPPQAPPPSIVTVMVTRPIEVASATAPIEAESSVPTEDN